MYFQVASGLSGYVVCVHAVDIGGEAYFHLVIKDLIIANTRWKCTSKKTILRYQSIWIDTDISEYTGYTQIYGSIWDRYRYMGVHGIDTDIWECMG